MFCFKTTNKTNRKESLMSNKPNLIFKYKPLSTRTDLIRFYDIIKNHRIFFPTSTQLNDPFEGQLPSIGLGIAGSSLMKKADREYGFVKEQKNTIHIMSLSEDCWSTQLWAYYCNNYTGVCFCFKTNQTFKDIRKVEYVTEYDNQGFEVIADLETIEKVLLKRVFQKKIGWKYENEWRMIRLSQNTEYLYFDERELIALIIGHNIDKETEQFILNTVPDNLPVYKTYPGEVTGLIHLIKHNYEITYDGREQDFIDNAEELMASINEE